MKLHFSGNRVLLLGGTCALALSTAEVLMAEGLHPVLTYRDQAGLNCIKERLGKSADMETVHVDLSDPSTVDHLMGEHGSTMDYLVDFAQGDMEKLVASADTTDVQQYFNAYITTRTAVVQQMTRGMLNRRKGRLIFISSTAAERSNPGQGFYGAAKVAAEALYRNVGIELARRGITTVIVRPGYIDCGRGRRFIKNSNNAVTTKIPIGRALWPLEIAETILFLLSDNACGFNATVLTLDGGLSATK